MKELSERQYLIIKTLNEKRETMNSNELCSLLNISPRTLRYEINNITDIIGKKVITSNKNGYSIDASIDNIQQLYEIKISNSTNYIKLLTLALLKENEINIYDLEESVFLSQSKIISSLKEINDKIKTFNIQFQKNGDTIFTYGNEYNKRRLLAHFFYSEVNTLANDVNNFDNYFTHFNLSDINHLVSESIIELNISLDNIYFKSVVISMAIGLQRIMDGYSVNGTPIGEKEIIKTAEFPFIKTFVDKANNYFNIHITPKDFCGLLNFVTGYFHNNENNDNQHILNSHEFNEKIKKILDATFSHYRLNIDYSSFFNNFMLHIHYLLVRAKNESFFKNDLTKSLSQSHPFIYDIAVYLSYQIQKEFNVNISNDEISLIAIYISMFVKDTVVHDLCKVVCIVPNYNTMRTTFINNLNENFANQIEIVQIINSYQELSSNVEYDFIITSLKNEFILGNTIYASPLLTPRDIHLIENKLNYLLAEKKKKKVRQLLLDYFDPDLFSYNKSDKRNGKKLLNDINEILVQKEIVQKQFYNNVLQREKMASTVFFNKFALPHAIDTVANKSKIYYFYSEKPIKWSKDENVNLVLLLTSTGYDKTFSEIYNLLFDILMDQETYNSLIQCKTFEEMIDFIIDKKN